MKKQIIAVALLLLSTLGLSADTINLVNNTSYMLTAQIVTAAGDIVGELVLSAGDASQWSNESELFGLQQNATQSLSPYTVRWFCANNQNFGVCNNISPGSLVLAQSCGGAQECPGPTESE